MAPANARDSVLVLSQGVDTLVLSVYGELVEGIAKQLEEAKQLAQLGGEEWGSSGLPAFDGTELRIHASGVRYYDYHLRSEDLTVKVRRPGGSSPLPPVSVRISAAALWRLGEGGRVASYAALAWLGCLVAGSPRVQVARVDLATDYQGRAISVEDLAAVVKRSDSVEVYYGDDMRIETVAAGRSNRLRLNLYDKSRQVAKKGLAWYRDLWAGCESYQADLATWRLEWQWGREFLREVRVETLEDLWAKLPELHAYGCEWFSFRVVNPSDMSHRHRWDVAAWWRVLSHWGEVQAPAVARVKQVRPRFVRLCLAAAGYLSSVMALADVEDAGEGLGAILGVLHGARGPGALDQALVAKRLRYGSYTMVAV